MTGYEEVMAALALYLGDGELPASEESIREVIGQENDPIGMIGEALDDYREHLVVKK